jgi:6-phosphofructokinase
MVLGHAQRGSVQMPCDRLMAQVFDVWIVDLLAKIKATAWWYGGIGK